jgi:hypothetical protein
MVDEESLMSSFETLIVFGPFLVLVFGLTVAMAVSHYNEVR